jgi:hypothetical protein
MSNTVEIRMVTNLKPAFDFFFILLSLERKSDEQMRLRNSSILEAEENAPYPRGVSLHIWPDVGDGQYEANIHLLSKDFRMIAHKSLQTNIRSNTSLTIVVEELNAFPVFKVFAPDIELDDKNRRLPDSDSESRRRALVHDFNDGLTFNYDRDYPGGIRFNGDVFFADHISCNKSLTVHGALLLNLSARDFAGGEDNDPLLGVRISQYSVNEVLVNLHDRISALEAKVAELSI